MKLLLTPSYELAIHRVMGLRRCYWPFLRVHRDGEQLAGAGHGPAGYSHVQDHGQGQGGGGGLANQWLNADEDWNLGNSWRLIFCFRCLFRRKWGERWWGSQF